MTFCLNPFLRKKLRELNAQDKLRLKNHITVLAINSSQCQRLLDDWDSLDALSNKTRLSPSKVSGKRDLNLWELVEQSLPLLIGDKIWRVRVLYHKVEKRFYFDVREVTLHSNDDMNYYLITDNGVVLPMVGWSKIIETIFKYLRKFK